MPCGFAPLETLSYSCPASPPNLLVCVPAEALALSFNPAAERPALRLKFSRYTLPDSVSSPSSYCAAKFLGSAAHLGRRRILPLLSALPLIARFRFRVPFRSGCTINSLSSRVNSILLFHLCKSVNDCEYLRRPSRCPGLYWLDRKSHRRPCRSVGLVSSVCR